MSMIKARENQNVEYKSSWNDKYLAWICGFANAQGAVMYFGVFKGTGLPMPRIEAVEGGIKVSFQRNNVNISQTDTNFVKDFVKGIPQDMLKELTERQLVILEIIASDSTMSAKAISERMSEKDSVTERTIQNDLAKIKKLGIIKRKGGRKNGEWIIIGGKA